MQMLYNCTRNFGFQNIGKSVDSVMSLPPLTDFGWSTDDNILSVIRDTEANVKRVNDTIQCYTKKDVLVKRVA
jgi:hypothetical protein